MIYNLRRMEYYSAAKQIQTQLVYSKDIPPRPREHARGREYICRTVHIYIWPVSQRRTSSRFEWLSLHWPVCSWNKI